MNETTISSRPSKLTFWIGWVSSALPIMMLGGGGIFAFFNPAMMEAGLKEQGWPVQVGRTLVVLEVASAILYAIPQTAVLGAILLTGYLGGAIASHVRAEQPWMWVPALVFGILVWLGLYLRDTRLRALVPLRR
jgi:DoxX-like family